MDRDSGRASAPRLTDGDLVERTLEGDVSAFDALIQRHQDRVYGLVLRMVGHAQEAEDVTQEAFLRAYRALGSFRRGAAFSTWLYRIAVNSCHSQGRKVMRRQRVEGVRLETAGDEDEQPTGIVNPAADGDTPIQAVERSEACARVQREVDGLPDDYRDVVLLRDFEGLDYAAIAEVLDISRAAVKSRLHRARLELASRLKDLNA